MHACIDVLLNPTPQPAPQVNKLEPLDELIEQGLKDHQIAKIYDWYTPDSQPDTKRVLRAKKGEEKPPTEKVCPPKLEGPTSQPSLNPIIDLAHRFTKERTRAN